MNKALLPELAKEVLDDLRAAAEVSRYPKAVAMLASNQAILRKAKEDVVFFAVLFLGHRWLADDRAEKHRAFLRDPAQRICLACGRGWGKSLCIAIKATHLLFTYPSSSWLITSSSQRQSMNIFEYVEDMVMNSPVLKPQVLRRTRTLIKLRTPFNSKIEALPCSKNKLRGKHPDGLFVDEASIVPPDMLTSELVPMLTKQYGPDSPMYAESQKEVDGKRMGFPKLWLAATPMGYEHPFRMAAMNPAYSRYTEIPSYSSPLVNSAMLAEWKGLLTTDEWTREIEAKWPEEDMAYFSRDLIYGTSTKERNWPGIVDPDLTLVKSPEDVKFIRAGINFAGLDLGLERDYSVLSIGTLIDGVVKHIYLKQFPLKTPYSTVEAFLLKAHEVLKFKRVIIDQTGVGEKFVPDVIASGRFRIGEKGEDDEVIGVFLTDVKKEEIFGNLRLQMEHGRVKVTDYQPLLQQMNECMYEYIRPKSGQARIHVKFWHPKEHHDDQLIAFALMVYGALGTPVRRGWFVVKSG